MHKIKIGGNTLIYNGKGVLAEVNAQSIFRFERSDYNPLQIRVSDKKVEFSILVNNFGERRWENIPVADLNRQLEKSFRPAIENGQKREILLHVCKQSSVQLISHLADWLKKNSVTNIHINIWSNLLETESEPIIPPSEIQVVPSDTKNSVKVPPLPIIEPSEIQVVPRKNKRQTK